MVVLVKYKQWEESGHVMLPDELVEKSKIVEIDDLTKLNSQFSKITDVKILKP